MDFGRRPLRLRIGRLWLLPNPTAAGQKRRLGKGPPSIALVLSRLEKSGLTPSPEADRRTLINGSMST